MTDEEKAEEYADWFWGASPSERSAIKQAYLAGAESREKQLTELEAQLSLKIVSHIKAHLCKQDADYDEPIISPKFLSDMLDQMLVDGFEG